jgi:hypothetical protein
MEHTAIRNIYPNAVTIRGSEAFDADDNPIVLDDTLVQNEIDRLQSEYDAQDYARKRKVEYPTIEELVVALYDSEDKTAVDEKRAEIKLKYPKPGA